MVEETAASVAPVDPVPTEPVDPATLDAVEEGWVDALCTCGAPESHVGKFCPERPPVPEQAPPDAYVLTASVTFDAYSLEDAQGALSQYFAQLRAGETATLPLKGTITLERGA